MCYITYERLVKLNVHKVWLLKTQGIKFTVHNRYEIALEIELLVCGCVKSKTINLNLNQDQGHIAKRRTY